MGQIRCGSVGGGGDGLGGYRVQVQVNSEEIRPDDKNATCTSSTLFHFHLSGSSIILISVVALFGTDCFHCVTSVITFLEEIGEMSGPQLSLSTRDERVFTGFSFKKSGWLHHKRSYVLLFDCITLYSLSIYKYIESIMESFYDVIIFTAILQPLMLEVQECTARMNRSFVYI